MLFRRAACCQGSVNSVIVSRDFRQPESALSDLSEAHAPDAEWIAGLPEGSVSARAQGDRPRRNKEAAAKKTARRRSELPALACGEFQMRGVREARYPASRLHYSRGSAFRW